ncbi:MAG: parallel beta-helix domain-containing protein [Blastocatellia bacterium]
MTASAKQMPIDRSGSTARTKPRRWLRLILALFVLLVAGFVALGVWPAPTEFTGDEGTVGVAAGGGGLKKDFPAMVIPTDNATTDPKNDERVALGRLLFFDPILSGANDISCATCHHPDLGFSDGRGLSMGKGAKGLGPERAGGAVVKRGAPSLWNATFNHMQFWDGRAPDLEEQARGPITSDIEMAENPDTLVGELKAIPEYAQKFDSAFGGAGSSGVNFDNVVKAVAAFERRLTANNAPFDRFVAGDQTALTEAQLRGFNLFRSGRTRCFECHGMPTFANRDFKIVGVPEVDQNNPDYGRFDVTKGEGNKYAFKVPTLRNAVLNPPYMHNGKFKTLEEVLDFYAAGGGPGVGFKEPKVDDKIHSYSITTEEKQDLIAFMYALVDESNAPEFPDRVPSGLSVVPRLDNAARALALKHNTGLQKDQTAKRAPQTITVKAGESIQAAVNRAQAGDTIEVMPGTYHEEVKIDLDNITLRGVTAQGSRPVFDGEKKLSDGVIATGSNFVIENFDVKHYVANGIVAQHARNVTFRDLKIDGTGLYGVYPVSCTGVTIERCTATGIADAALYVGQSRDIVVRDSEAYNNVTGIEIENSINAVVENNYVHDNTGGILVFVLPNNVSKIGRDCIVKNNRVINNNHPNFANPNSIVSNVMPGSGILVMAADNTEVTANEIRGNDTYGVAVFSLEVAFPKGTAFDVGPTPENTFIHGNTYADNGRNPSEKMTKEGINGADLVWDLSGWSNKWQESSATSATPLLSARLPAFARRAEWRALQFMQKYL